jgi:murein DD-endopeptidase MepM/ murein hydrolase activator NlpD
LKRSQSISLILLVILTMLLPVGTAGAQEAQPEGQIYIVQPGDTLSGIAAKFGVSIEDLIRVNQIANPDNLVVGTRLIIPGPGTISGEVVTVQVSYGMNLRSLSRWYHISEADLARINRLASPAELYVGKSLVLPTANSTASASGRAAAAPRQSLFELAVAHGTDPWNLVATNTLSGTWDMLPGDVLLLPAGSGTPDEPQALPQAIHQVEISSLPGVQGKALTIRVAAEGEVALNGSLTGYPLHFFPDQDGQYVAQQGIYAKQTPGLYPLTITGTLEGGILFNYSQLIMVQSGNYVWEDVTGVPESTLDPAVTRPEEEEWYALAAPATPVKMWDGKFGMPVPLAHNDCLPFNAADPYHCWISLFGSRRSYNGGPRDFYHAGLDMYAGMGTEIHAAAAGVVVFAGWLDVRGNATMIDHGWGVYTGYLHQSEFRVSVGDKVEAGQVIGLVGGTGRAGGPHLHFEVLVGDVPVNPIDWWPQSYP